jgi:hypothetical protein
MERERILRDAAIEAEARRHILEMIGNLADFAEHSRQDDLWMALKGLALVGQQHTALCGGSVKDFVAPRVTLVVPANRR